MVTIFCWNPHLRYSNEYLTHLILYGCESKVFEYFGNVRLNWIALGSFSEVAKLINHTGQWDAGLTWDAPNLPLDLAWSSVFFLPLENFLNNLVLVLWLTDWSCWIPLVFDQGHHDKELYLLHFLQLCLNIQRRDRTPTNSKARRTSEASSTWWDWKVWYGGPYMEGKRKLSALMVWSWNNRWRRTLED